MQNLYDLLGVRPDDDAETLKKAFRTAAKASHPDHQGGDPQAAARFSQILEAYKILRNAEQRAAYDRLLEFKRRPLRHKENHKEKRSRSGMKRHVVHDLMAGALLAIMLAVGYELFARIPEMSGGGAAGVTARESVQVAADHPVERRGAAGRDRPERVPAPQMPIAVPTAPAATVSAASDHGRPETTNGAPVSNPAGQTIAVVGRDSGSDAPTGAGVPGKTAGEPPVRRDVPSLDAPFSAAEQRNGVPADERRDGKAAEPAGANTGGVKLPEIKEIKTSARARVAAKRHTPSRPRFEQAALENRNIQAPDETPSRVFGVGF
jgi:curved DNA-binding protein CbpA